MSDKEASKPTDGKAEDKLPVELENQKELLALESQRLDNFDKKLKIKGLTAKNELEKSKNELDLSRHYIDQINTLRWLLSDTMLDEDATQIGSEAKFKHLFVEKDQQIIKKKIMTLVKNLK